MTTDVAAERTAAPFGRDLMYYVPAKIIPAGVAFLIVVLLTHRLSPDAYGRYARILALVTLVDTIASTWLRQSILRYYPEYVTRGTGEAFQEHLLGLVAAQVVGIAAIAGAALLMLGQPLEAGLTVVILVLLMSFSYLTTLYQSARRPARYALVSLAQSLAQMGWVMAFVYVRHGGFVPAAAAVAAGYAAGIAGIVAVSRGTGLVLLPRPRVDWALVRRMLSYGLPMSAWLLCFQLLALGNRLIIAAARSASELGPYASTGDLINGSLSLLMTPFLLAAHPVIMQLWAAGEDRVAIEALIGRVMRYLLVLVAPVFVIMLGLSTDLFALALGPRFRLEAWVIQVLVACSLASGFGLYAHKGLEVAGRTGVMLGVAAGAAAVNLALCFAFVGRYGYRAAAVITLLTYVGYVAVVYVFARRYVRVGIPAWSLARVLAAATASGAGLMLARRQLATGLLQLVPVAGLVLLTGAIYLSVLLASGELAPEYRRLTSRTRDADRSAKRGSTGG
jgi:O-antigen/teichoic acid export membrane protein